MDFELDVHTHTIASGHAYGTLTEMAKEAAVRGLKLLGITEHTHNMPGTCDDLYFVNLRVVPREMFGIRLMLGAELNIMDYEGTVDLPDWIIDRLDLRIASIHGNLYQFGTMEENTAAVLGAMRNPKIDIIGHPDDGRFPTDYETLVCAAKEHHVLLEVNNSSFSPGCNRKNSRENAISMLEYCRKYQVPVVLDSDAHCEVDVGNHRFAHSLLEEISFPEELVVNTSLEKAARFLPALQKHLALGGAGND